MSKIARATAVMALSVAPFWMGHAEAQPSASFVPPPGAAPPWADTTTATEAPPAPTSIPSPAPAATAASAPAAPPAPTEELSATTAIPVAVTPMQGMTTPRQAVSMRSGPNTSFPVIGTLRPGMPLRVLATANYGWMQVESPQGTGWAYGSYLAQGDDAPAVPPPAPPPEVLSH